MTAMILVAWRNLWRNKRRTLITLAAGAFGLMFCQGYNNLANGIYSQMIEDAVRSGSGHVALYAPDYLRTREQSLSFPAHDLAERLSRLPGVRHVVPRLYLAGLAQAARGSRGVIILGVDPSVEWSVNPFAKTVVEGRLFNRSSSGEAVLGRELMKNMKLRIGRKFVVMTQNASGDIASEVFRLVGAVDTGMGEIDSATVFISLDSAAKLAGRPGDVHEMALVLESVRIIPETLTSLASLPGSGGAWRGVSWQEAMPELAGHIRTDLFSLKIMIGFIYLIIGIGIVNTLLMSVLERTREFGVMLALGTPISFLVGTVVSEGLFMGVIAASSGSAMGAAVTAALARWGIDLAWLYGSDRLEVSGAVFSSLMKARWMTGAMLNLALIVVLLYAVSAVYPAWKAGRMKPVASMRYT